MRKDKQKFLGEIKRRWELQRSRPL